MTDELLSTEEKESLRLLVDSIISDSETGRIGACGHRLKQLEMMSGHLWRELPNRRDNSNSED